MSGFDAGWLDLREPADRRARSGVLPARLHDFLRTRPAGALPISDLGGGTGANCRALAPRLGCDQAWRILDHDTALLSALPGRIEAWAGRQGFAFGPTPHAAEAMSSCVVSGDGFAASVEAQLIDLAAEAGSLQFTRRGIVTASALLDLVGEHWLAGLVERIAAGGAAACFALTYDGCLRIEPALPEDAHIRELVNAHQRTDKGFGPALGPTATECAQRLFRAAGFQVWVERSDWQLSGDERPLQHALVDGWVEAATEIDPGRSLTLEAWAAQRHAAIDAGGLGITVGHQDLLALPG